MDHSKKTTYLFSIDALRVIAIIAVIAIHSSIKILATIDHNLLTGFVPFFFNQITRFAVPLFFLISGFVLELNYREKIPYLSFFQKRATRVIFPFIFWSLFYVIFNGGVAALDFSNPKFIYHFLQGKASYHLYFIPTLIIFYLAFPLFHKTLNILKNPIILCFVLVLQTYLLYIDYYIKPLKINQDLRIALLSFAMFLLGMIASHNKEKLLAFTGKNFYIVLISFLTLLFLMPFHVFTQSIIRHTTRFIYSQYHILNYIYTLVFALFSFYLLEKTQFLRKYFIILSKLSFFVFFIHVFVQEILWRSIVMFLLKNFGENILVNPLFTPILILAVSTISFLCAFIIHKIPKIIYVTG